MNISPAFETTLYRGTICEISKIDVNAGRGRKDFGKGFYAAVSKPQAIGMMHKKYREFMNRPGRDAEGVREHLYEIRLSPEAMKRLNVKVFSKPDAEWLDFILVCRNSDATPRGCDMVIGPTADDDTNACLKTYARGFYGETGSMDAKRELLSNLKAGNLGIQYFFANQRAADAAIDSVVETAWWRQGGDDMTEEKVQLVIGYSVMAVTKFLMERYSLTHGEAYKKLLGTEFFAVLNDRESGLCFEPDEALCDACLLELEQGPDAMWDYLDLE